MNENSFFSRVPRLALVAAVIMTVLLACWMLYR